MCRRGRPRWRRTNRSRHLNNHIDDHDGGHHDDHDGGRHDDGGSRRDDDGGGRRNSGLLRLVLEMCTLEADAGADDCNDQCSLLCKSASDVSLDAVDSAASTTAPSTSTTMSTATTTTTTTPAASTAIDHNDHNRAQSLRATVRRRVCRHYGCAGVGCERVASTCVTPAASSRWRHTSRCRWPKPAHRRLRARRVRPRGKPQVHLPRQRAPRQP